MSQIPYLKYGTHYREVLNDSPTYHLICDIVLLSHRFKLKSLEFEYTA